MLSPEVLTQLPIKVRWQGWDSDTYRLRALGWKIWATEGPSYDFRCKAICLSARHPSGELVLAGFGEIDPCSVTVEFNTARYLVEVGIEMKSLTPGNQVVRYSMSVNQVDMLERLRPIDGFAYLPEGLDRSWVDVREFNIFKYSEDAGEIFLPQASVEQCLSQILKVQYPTQELLKKDSKLVKPALCAKIYSLAA